jgi:outer membrane protein assembly factor BamB
MASDHDRILAELAVRRRFLAPEDVQRVLSEVAAAPGAALGEFLVKTGRITAAQRDELEGQAVAREATLRAPPSGAAAPEPATPAALFDGERYELRETLGEGGMGRVLRAYDRRLRRAVAMKIIRPGAAVDRADTLRFLEEAQATAQLQHPYIVPIHDVGLDGEGNLYFTMREVEGRTLRDVIDRLAGGHVATNAEFTLTRLLQIFQQVCHAVGFGHSRGVLHRDLKPDNVMIGAFGEVFVMDWGLAKVMRTSPGDVAAGGTGVFTDRGADGSTRTMDGALAGTPHYMSPEQAEGRVEGLDARSDVWALGALLYEMLTFRRPVRGRTVEEVLEHVRLGDVVPVAHAAERPVPRELAAIAMKALRRDRESRYGAAREMVDDVQAYLEGRRGSAWKDTPLSLAAKWVRRHRALTGVAAAGMVACAAVWAWLRTRPGWLELTTRPDGVEVFVDGRPAGRTPVSSLSLSPGEHDVELRLADHLPQRHSVLIGPAATNTVEYSMFSAFGLLSATSTPSGARVIVDGAELGTTTLVARVPMGRCAVRIELSGFLPFQSVLDVRGGNQLERLDAKLVPNVGRLKVETHLEGVTLKVLDPATRAETRSIPVAPDVEAPAGRWIFRFEKEGYLAQEREIELPLGGERRVAAGLVSRVVWEAPVKAHVRESPVVADLDGDGTPDLFVILEPDRAVALDGGTGRPLWTLAGGRQLAYALAVRARDRWDVVVAGEHLARLEGRSGKLLWTSPLGVSILSPPRTWDADDDGGEEIFLFAESGTGTELRCVAARDGSLVAARRDAPSCRFLSALRAPGTIAIAATDRGAWSVGHLPELSLHSWADGERPAAVYCVADLNGDGDEEAIGLSEDRQLRAWNDGGGRRWSVPAPEGPLAAIAVALKGKGDSASVVVAAPDGLHVLNGATGEERARWLPGRAVTPALSAGDLDGDGRPEILAAVGDGLAAIRGDGMPLWTHSCGGPLRAPPSVADVTGDGVLDAVVLLPDGAPAALDGGEGRVAWSVRLPGRVDDAPAPMGGASGFAAACLVGRREMVFLDRSDGRASLRVEVPAGPLSFACGEFDTPWIATSHVGSRARLLRVGDPDGIDLEGPLDTAQGIVLLEDADADGVPEVAALNGSPREWIVWSGRSGRRLWTTEAPPDSRPPVPLGPKALLAVSHNEAVALDVLKGRPSWSVSLPAPPSGSPACASRVWIPCIRKVLVEIDPESRNSRTTTLPETAYIVAASGDIAIFACGEGVVAAKSAGATEIAWSVDFPGTVVSLSLLSPTDGGAETIAVGLSSGRLAVLSLSGRRLWTTEPPGVGGLRAADCGDGLLAVTEDGTASLIRKTTASRTNLWRGGHGPSGDGRHALLK